MFVSCVHKKVVKGSGEGIAEGVVHVLCIESVGGCMLLSVARTKKMPAYALQSYHSEISSTPVA